MRLGDAEKLRTLVLDHVTVHPLGAWDRDPHRVRDVRRDVDTATSQLSYCVGALSSLLGDHLAVGLPFVHQPGRRVGDQGADLAGVQGVGDAGPRQARSRDAQFPGHHAPREGAVALQLGQPQRRVGAQGVRVGFVPGVTLTKWTTVWAERFRRTPLQSVEIAQKDQRAALDQGLVDLCFVRLPIDTAGLHVIPLYEATPVAWVSKEHPIAAFDEVTLADLADETVLTKPDAESINQVALEIAVLRVPMSIARAHGRRDLTYRPVTDASGTTIGLAWRAEDPHPLTDEFIGVVRGRTANSSRTRQERTAAAPRTGRARPGRRR